MMRWAIFCGVLILLTGCGLVPEVSHQPQLHNPFPQLTKVAIAPFINLSSEPTVDGRQFGLAYFSELQAIPGFEVVPIGVVERAMHDHHLTLNSPAEVRRLAQLLDVDAVVVGAVTDFTPYYPPRCTIQVEWYAANSCFHAIPPGYGLPWGTPEEEDIPQSLVMEAEMALAREQMKTQTPDSPRETPDSVPARRNDTGSGVFLAVGEAPSSDGDGHGGAKNAAARGDASRSAGSPGGKSSATARSVKVAQATSEPSSPTGMPQADAQSVASAPRSVLVGGPEVGLPPNWPDPRGFVPPPPSCHKPDCYPTDEPVLRHTRTYLGNDPDFTAALKKYTDFRDDARFGGWPAYLQRSDDFIRFCCHKHIAEMLTARGGAGETRVVWRWSESR
jgi:hypothetical protein